MIRWKNLVALLGTALLLTEGRGRAETVCWSDNFETNAGSRWTTNSAWQIGSPTTGPAVNASGFRTYSGAKCAGTGLKSSAPANADARLVCTNYNGAAWLLVPSADQFPRLRFWQWFNFVNAGGYVEILQEGSTNWLALSATNLSRGFDPAAYSSGVWSRPALDLKAFSGTSVQIAFHFFSGGSGYGSDPGWYIDDVAVVTNAPVFNNPEGFEAGLGDWSVAAGTWEAGTPTTGPATNAAGFRAHSGTHCAGTVLAGNYGWNLATRLVSPRFLVPASGNQALRFWQWYSFVNAGGLVEVNNGTASLTGTTNVTIITTTNASLNTNLYQLFGATDVGYTTPFYWNPTIGGWTNATKVLGNVFDVFYGGYYFEAGTAPLALLGQANADYRALSVTPLPPTTAATNYPAWQGMAWSSATSGTDLPVGYFGTNYSYSYTTNTTVIFTENSWQTVSPTNLSVGGAVVSSGGWTNTSLDLSAYAGQTVQVAFHFFSGSSGYGNAPGWYVDDVSFVATPLLTAPANAFTLYAGTVWTVTNDATLYPPTSPATFTLLSGPTNNAALNPTNGVLTWNTPTTQAAQDYPFVVAVTDANGWSATNRFVVTVLPPPASPILKVTNSMIALNGGFQFGFIAPSNTTWLIQVSTNLTDWQPIFTNTAGAGGSLQFNDSQATNFPLRFYRAVFP